MPATMSTAAVPAELVALFEKEINLSSLQLPVMPEVAVRVRETASQPGSSASSLAQIIEVDPALAARLIKMTNSALFAGLSEIRDLQHAIGRLGTAMVVAVALGAAGKEMFRSGDPMLKELLDRAWHRSIYAAALGRRLGPRGGIEPEEGFLAGLLHAVGEPILIGLLEKMLRDGRVVRPTLEQVQMAIEPTEYLAGARLLRGWSIPEFIVCSVEYRRAPHEAPADHRAAVSVVALAASVGAAIVSGLSPSEAARAIVGARPEFPAPLDEGSVIEWMTLAERDGKELARTL